MEDELKKGKNVILEIEIQGARKIRNMFPDAVLIFIMPPSGDELLRRLKGRGSENQQMIRDRVRRASKEAEGIEDYDFVFVNDDPAACAHHIDELIRSMRQRTGGQGDFIARIRCEIEALQKEL